MADPGRSAEELFGEALELPPEHRSAFLDQVCSHNLALRQLVEQFLLADARAGNFLKDPAFTPGGTGTLSAVSVAIPSRFEPGQLISRRFAIVRFIARGGMGEVYEAKDQFLQEARVALKIIRPEIAADAATSARFEQEVILARKVVHPHLCPIYELFRCEEPAPPFLFLTMKLLRGETLDSFLKSSKNSDSVVRVQLCSQLLSGVAALHAGGIVHRDLKPKNVMLEQTNQRLNISIMDFGLARLHDGEASVLGSGMIAGTPGYMAPEMLRGERPTKATDLFALGVVLHQILTGERPTESGRGLSLTPSPLLRSVRAPIELVRAVEDFLSIDPERRDRAFSRVQVAESEASTPMFIRSSSFLRRTAWYWTMAAFAVVALGFAVLITPAQVSGTLDSTQITFSSEPKEPPLFTDGNRLYFQIRGSPSAMAVSGGTIALIPQVPPGMRLMDVSADGSKILEWKPEAEDEFRRGSLWIGSSLGGAPRRLNNYLVNTPDFGGAAWSPDGQTIAFTDRRTLYVADADGTNVRKIWEAPLSVDGVCFSPDGRELTVSLWSPTIASRLWRLQSSGQAAHLLVPDWPSNFQQYEPRWTPDGQHFVFLSDRDGVANVYEWVVPRWFEFWRKPAAVRITGNQISILASAPARDSTHLFVLARADQGAMQAFDPHTGKMEPFLGGLGALEFVVSPDRKWMTYTAHPVGYLWKSRVDGSEPMQLTNTPALNPRWSPDGKSLVYSNEEGLYLISADGGTPEKLIPTETPQTEPSWSPDGKSILFDDYTLGDQPSHGIFVLNLATRKVSVLPGAAGFHTSAWSPDGKFIAAIAQNPSRMMLYSASTKAWTVLKQFQVPWGFWTWSRDSKSLYMALIKGQNGIYRLTVPSGKWEKASELASVNWNMYDRATFVSLTADGQPATMSDTGVAQIYSLQWKH